MISKLIAKLKAVWASLPHQVQAGVTVFASMALTTLAKEFEQLLSGNAAFTWLALRHDIAVAVMAGIVALKAFYLLPNGTAKIVADAQLAQASLPSQKQS
jgi:hypothetical protein